MLVIKYVGKAKNLWREMEILLKVAPLLTLAEIARVKA